MEGINIKQLKNLAFEHSPVLIECRLRSKTFQLYAIKVEGSSDEEKVTGYANLERFIFLPEDYREYLNRIGNGRVKEYMKEKCWLVYTGYLRDVTLIDFSSPPIDINSEFTKIGWDREVTYGDGGLAKLIYPLYAIKTLPLKESVKNTLINKLNELGDSQNDWHDECPVLDIIDPDLAPNYYRKFKDPENASLRSKYSWYPTDITINENDLIRIEGPIHNLPLKGNKILYNCILKAFQEMLPGFRKLGITKKGQKSKIQVVVKAQKYVIPPGTSYSGKWHVEGMTENIVAGGVYYCKIDSGFDCDSVVFRPRIAPDSNYASYNGIEVEQTLDIQEGTAIVFSNILPHKFLKLSNNTDQALSRLFLNFFIVDPTRPIQSTTFYWESERALNRLKILPKPIIEEILSFLFSRPNKFEAIEKRRQVRASMNNEVNQWGFIHYGNSGDVEFIDYNNRCKRLKDYDKVASDIYE